jgi:broad specificity phosphatase PhoE
MVLTLLIVFPATVTDGLLLLPHPVVASSSQCIRNKTLHLIRHAQGTHNEAEESAAEIKLHERSPADTQLHAQHGKAWVLLESVSGRKHWDAPLTPIGREQAYALRASLRHDPDFLVDAVVSSPFRRTLMTALLSLPQLEALATSFDIGETAQRPTPEVTTTDLLRERIGE